VKVLLLPTGVGLDMVFLRIFLVQEVECILFLFLVLSQELEEHEKDMSSFLTGCEGVENPLFIAVTVASII